MPEPRRPDRPAPVDPMPDELATPELVAALLVDGDDDLAAWAIGQALEARSRSEVYDTVVRRAMELVGSNWIAGRWSISQEHLATVALRGALARVRPPDMAETRIGPVAVLAAPEGEDHDAGLACLAQVLEEHRWRVENLGADVPADDLVAFVASRGADLVGLSIGTRQRVEALRRTLEALRAVSLDRRPAIIVGGHGTIGLEGEIAGADLIAASLVDAERFIAQLGSPQAVARGG